MSNLLYLASAVALWSALVPATDEPSSREFAPKTIKMVENTPIQVRDTGHWFTEADIKMLEDNRGGGLSYVAGKNIAAPKLLREDGPLELVAKPMPTFPLRHFQEQQS